MELLKCFFFNSFLVSYACHINFNTKYILSFVIDPLMLMEREIITMAKANNNKKLYNEEQLL